MDNLSQEALQQKSIFLVLGMHRSGTSALTGLLYHLGCSLPLNLMKASEANPRGHFESESIRLFNDRILSECDSQWNDWRSLPEDWLQSPKGQERLSEARDLLQAEFQNTTLGVIKDPRISRMVPFWNTAIASSGFNVMPVLTLRNPIEVAKSLKKRDGIENPEAFLIWLRHVLDAEASTRGSRRYFTTYESVLNNWGGVSTGLQDKFDVLFPSFDDEAKRRIDEFVSVHLRHHAEPSQRLDDDPDVIDWLRRTYKVLEKLSTHSEEPGDYDVLDEVRREFNIAERGFRSFMQLGAQRRRYLYDKASTLTATLEAQNQKIRLLDAELKDAHNNEQAKLASLATAESNAAAAIKELELTYAKAAQLEMLASEHRVEAEQATILAEEADRDRQSIETSYREALAVGLEQSQDILVLKSEIEAKERLLAQHRYEAERDRLRADEAEKARQAVEEDHEQLLNIIAEMNKELNALRDEVWEKESALSQRRHEADEATRRAEASEAQSANQAAEILVHKTDLAQIKGELKKLEQEFISAKAQWLEEAASQVEVISRLQTEVASATLKIKSAAVERDVARAEANRAEAERVALATVVQRQNQDMGRMADLLARSYKEAERSRQEANSSFQELERMRQETLLAHQESERVRQQETQSRQEAEHLCKVLSERSLQIASLEEEYRVVVGRLDADRSRLEEEVNSLRSSTSWRLTAPIRTVLDRLRGVR